MPFRLASDLTENENHPHAQTFGELLEFDMHINAEEFLALPACVRESFDAVFDWRAEAI